MAMRALGLVNRTVREINEMRYEFDEPFIVDASRAQTELGVRATPLIDAVEQTMRCGTARQETSSPQPSNPESPPGSPPAQRTAGRSGRRLRECRRASGGSTIAGAS